MNAQDLSAISGRQQQGREKLKQAKDIKRKEVQKQKNQGMRKEKKDNTWKRLKKTYKTNKNWPQK